MYTNDLSISPSPLFRKAPIKILKYGVNILCRLNDNIINWDWQLLCGEKETHCVRRVRKLKWNFQCWTISKLTSRFLALLIAAAALRGTWRKCDLIYQYKTECLVRKKTRHHLNIRHLPIGKILYCKRENVPINMLIILQSIIWLIFYLLPSTFDNWAFMEILYSWFAIFLPPSCDTINWFSVRHERLKTIDFSIRVRFRIFFRTNKHSQVLIFSHLMIIHLVRKNICRAEISYDKTI